MKKYIYILAVSIILPALMSCQPTYRAQKQMDKYNYAKAIDILKKAETKEKTHDAAIPMLAECYRMQHDIENAKAAYAQAVTIADAKPEVFYYYAKALQSTGNYVEARDMFLTYSKKKPSDPRGKLYASYCDSILGPWKLLKPKFEVKTVNNINTSESDFGPAINNGDLVFASDFSKNPAEGQKYGWTGRGYLNIMKSTPETAGDFWGSMSTPVEFDSKLNQPYHDGPASFSADGNTIYFTRSFFGKAKREGIFKTNELKIFYATKTNGAWGDVKPFFLNSKEYSVGHPSLSTDGQSLYFVSDMPGGQGGTDIWMCKREGEEWGHAKNLGKTINTKENEMFPTIQDNTVLYFSSEGHPGYGAMDIYKSSNENGNWTTPVNLKQPINSSYDDFAIAYAPGSKIGFFSSNRTGGTGNDDIYGFRTIEPPLPAFISGLVKDKISMQPIAGATVFLYNPITGKVKVLKTDNEGIYKSVVDTAANYVVKATMSNFIADCTPLPLATLKPGTITKAPRDLFLDRLVINKTFKIDNIYYDFDKSDIREDAKPELDKLVQIMNENRINVELSSNTDSRGPFSYNDKLSQRRAESVVKYILQSGIDTSRIVAHAYGEHQLINQCADGVKCTPEEHQANRRTEFKVTGYTAPPANPEQFDPGKFNEGDEIELNSLPAGFLIQCK